MADTSFFGATGTTASTQNTIQTSVDAAAASATAASSAQTATEAARDLALGYKNAAATSETNAAASAVTANQNAANINAVANIASDVTAVAGKATQIGLLGTSDAIADMNTLGTSAIVADMDALADRVSQMAVLGTSDVVADMNTLGTSAVVADMDALADRVSQMDLLGTTDAVSDMNTLGTSANVTAMSNVSGSIANVNTVATNISSVNDFADKYRIGSSDPSSDNDEGDLFYNTSSNSLKVYTGSAWEQGVTAGSGFLPLSGGALTGDLSLNTNLVFEGSTADANETTITATDPTADRTITVPDKTGTLVTVASDGTTGQLLRTDGSGNYSFVTVQTNLSGDSNPTLSGDLDVGTHDIVSSSNNDISLLPNGSGKVVADGNGSSGGISLTDGLIEMRTGGGSVAQIDMYCEVSNAHKVSIKAPAHSNYSGNVNFTLPSGNGSNGQFLQTDGSGNLSYATVAQPSNATTSAAGLMSASDKTKMDGIEASADVTDTANVTAAGAAMLSGATFTGAVTLTNSAPQVRLKDTDVNRQLDVTYGTRAVNFDNEMATGEDMDTVAPWTAFRFIDDSETREVLRVDTAKVTVNKPIEMGSQSVKFGTSKWAIVLDGNDLDFQYNGTTVFKLASNGAVTSADDITAFGSP